MAWRLLAGLVLALALAVSAAVADDPRATREAGLALARGQVEQAITLFTQALQDKTLPNERRAVLLSDRGVAFARLQKPKEAIEDFNRAVQLYPEFAAIYNNRGTVLLGLGAVREAMKDFDRALLLAPGYAAAYANRASAHLRLGAFDLALADYNKAITLVPVNPAAFTGRGRVHLAALRPETAIRDFTRAVGFDARFGAAYRARAEAKAMLERHEEAVEDFSRAIAFDARNAELYVLRGAAYLAAGGLTAAVKDFSTALEHDARHALAYASRGLAYAKAYAYNEALNDFARAMELEPRLVRAFAYRAWTYRQQQPDLALKDVERALKLDADSPEAYWARGAIAEAQGRGAEAVADYAKALTIDPHLKDARLALHRLGAPPVPEEEIAGAGRERWKVFARWPQYVAVNDQMPRLKVDIEMLGKGQPRVLDWEVKAPPFANIGVLRFHAGEVDGPRGPEAVERVAIVDLQTNAVVAVETDRRGRKKGLLTWDAGKLVLASADGPSEELTLRGEKKEPPPRRVTEKKETWSPWGSSSSKSKPKTLFDLIFGK